MQKSDEKKTDPTLIDIPTTKEGVSRMLSGNLLRHPGLLAAQKSLKNKRSSKNFYILTIGLTGAGKSSAINLLFDNPTVTKVGDGYSTTTNINEFRIPIPIDELGIKNSELRVIDTPGMGDTRGLEQDAQFLATLESFLDDHEELSERIPNVVLIFHPFIDNRFAGFGSQFVKMLHAFDSFKKRITDPHFSNVIFVFSHYCSETQELQKKPQPRLELFKQTIEEFTQFPKPITTCLAENKAAEQHLPKVNGYFKLPNGDFYPRNLFEKIQKVTSNGGDPIGNAVITTAFRDPDQFQITSVTYKLLDANSAKVGKYLSILTRGGLNLNKTEISELLSTSYEKMNATLKQKYPDALPYLQKMLNIHNINYFADVPKTTYAILSLLSSIKQNEGIKHLLEDALKIKPPIFQQNTVTGYGYNVFQDTPLYKSPFKLGETIHSDIGYLFPASMKCDIQNQMKDFFLIEDTKSEYIKQRLLSFGIHGRLSEEMFTGQILPGFNVKNITFRSDNCKLTAVREFRKFTLTLNDRPELTSEFTKFLLNLPVFNETDHENVQIWNEFFKNYGTHVVKQIYGGGSIAIELKSDTGCTSNFSQTLLGLIEFAEGVTILTNDTKLLLNGGGIEHKLIYKGGNEAYYASDLTKFTQDESASLMQNWKDSLRLNPTILLTDLQLLPMNEVARKVGHKQNISQEIERATSLLFNSSLIYIRPKKVADNTDRQNTKLNTTNTDAYTFLREQFARSEEKINNLMTQMQEASKKAATDRAELEKQLKKQIGKQEEKLKSDIDLINTFKSQLDRAEAANTEARKNYTKLLNDKDKNINTLINELSKLKSTATPSSCLKHGTLILLATGKEKPVQELQIGDVLLDHELNPTKLIGITSEFLLDQAFYGFDNTSFFFTDTHILTGPTKKFSVIAKDLQFYVQNKERLLEQNPLMQFLPIANLQSDNCDIYKFNRFPPSLEIESVKVFKDPTLYPVETLIYFIQVDSLVGTYFANGYLCRHEIPPLEHWPNTMSILFSLYHYPDFVYFENVPYSLTSISVISQVVKDVKSKVQETLKALNVKDLNMQEPKIEFNENSAELVINKIFNHQSFSVFGMGIYNQLGPILSTYLDTCEINSCIPENYVGGFQKLLLQVISQQITESVESKVKTLNIKQKQ